MIDDDALFLQAILELLEEKGFHGIGFNNSLVALQIAKQEVFDLILCDIKMPQLNGYEVLMALRQDPITEKIPFIFMVAERPDSDRSRAIALGADDYLTKPFNTDDLLQAINAQLPGHQPSFP